MRLSGQSQAELIKAALVLAAAGVIVYYGKKFVDSFTSKIPDIATIPEKVITAAGDALGSASAAVVEVAKSGIEKANDNIAQVAPKQNTSIAANAVNVSRSSGFAVSLPFAVASSAGVSLGEKLLSALGIKKSYGVNYENQDF
jgi:uncharacterized protein (UPF0333 family)